MPTVITSGTLVTDGSEQTLTTQTASNNYVLSVDIATMTPASAGFVLEVRIKTKQLAAGTSKLAYYAVYTFAATGIPHRYSWPIPVPAGHEIIATLKRTAGGALSIPWELMSVN